MGIGDWGDRGMIPRNPWGLTEEMQFYLLAMVQS